MMSFSCNNLRADSGCKESIMPRLLFLADKITNCHDQLSVFHDHHPPQLFDDLRKKGKNYKACLFCFFEIKT